MVCRWNRQWTAEENRHGDLMNKYCYLTGRVNMKVRLPATWMRERHLMTGCGAYAC